MSDRIQISHYYTTGTTAPEATNLGNGEIAVSMNTNNEKLYIKNNDNRVVPFISYNALLKSDNMFIGENTFSKTTNLNSAVFTGGIDFTRGCTGATIGTGTFTLSGGDVVVCGTTTSTGGFFDTSDERVKNFGEKINVDLDKLSSLKKAYFQFNDNRDDNLTHIGVSAQEVKELYPEIVRENEIGILTVDYSKLSVVALEAVDVLYKKNKELEERLNKIEQILGC